MTPESKRLFLTTHSLTAYVKLRHNPYVTGSLYLLHSSESCSVWLLLHNNLREMSDAHTAVTCSGENSVDDPRTTHTAVEPARQAGQDSASHAVKVFTHSQIRETQSTAEKRKGRSVKRKGRSVSTHQSVVAESTVIAIMCPNLYFLKAKSKGP